MLKKWTTQLAEMIEGPLPENRKRRDVPLTFKIEYLQSIPLCVPGTFRRPRCMSHCYQDTMQQLVRTRLSNRIFTPKASYSG